MLAARSTPRGELDLQLAGNVAQPGATVSEWRALDVLGIAHRSIERDREFIARYAAFLALAGVLSIFGAPFRRQVPSRLLP